METVTNAPATRRIESSKGRVTFQFKKLWRYRELILFLVWRDIKVRYKQTVLGASWAVLQPFLTMVVFTVFFGNLAHMPSDDLPYFLFSFSALVPWTFFAGSISKAADSLVSNTGFLTKIYFPRLIIPIAAVISGIVDFVIAFVILILMMLVYKHVPTANIIWLPFFVLISMALALGVGLWLATLNVRYRDVRYVVPFLIQSWLYATPIVYPSSLIQNPTLRAIYGLNPMAGVIEGFRWALFGTNTPPGLMTIISILIVIFILLSGAIYFRRMESTFADMV